MDLPCSSTGTLMIVLMYGEYILYLIHNRVHTAEGMLLLHIDFNELYSDVATFFFSANLYFQSACSWCAEISDKVWRMTECSLSPKQFFPS